MKDDREQTRFVKQSNLFWKIASVPEGKAQGTVYYLGVAMMRALILLLALFNKLNTTVEAGPHQVAVFFGIINERLSRSKLRIQPKLQSKSWPNKWFVWSFMLFARPWMRLVATCSHLGIRHRRPCADRAEHSLLPVLPGVPEKEKHVCFVQVAMLEFSQDQRLTLLEEYMSFSCTAPVGGSVKGFNLEETQEGQEWE